jgi:hypothetical protein
MGVRLIVHLARYTLAGVSGAILTHGIENQRRREAASKHSAIHGVLEKFEWSVDAQSRDLITVRDRGSYLDEVLYPAKENFIENRCVQLRNECNDTNVGFACMYHQCIFSCGILPPGGLLGSQTEMANLPKKHL